MLLALHANPKDVKGQLVSFRISNGALDAKNLPKKLKLLNWGSNQTIKGPVIVGEETVKQLSVNQAKLGYDRIALDFNHQSVPGSDTYEKDPLEVAAYGTPVVIPGDGLYLENIEWTPAGEKFAANYHDLSPTPKLDARGEVIFLHSVALCRQGAVKDLSFYNASFLTPMSTTAPASTEASTTAVDYKGLLVSLLQKLGVQVPDAPSDSDIASMVDQFKVPEKKVAAADDDNATNTTMTMTPGEKALLARLQKLEDGQSDGERAGLLTLAASHGKVIPLSAEQIKLVPISALKELVEKLPAGTVPLNSTRTGGAQPGIVALTAEEKTIIRNLGIKEEDYVKQKKTEGGVHSTVV